MSEVEALLQNIPFYSAKEFDDPQILLDFVGVGHDGNFTSGDGQEKNLIWLIARIQEIDHAVLAKETDLYGWARSHPRHSKFRRFPIEDFPDFREGQLLFHPKGVRPQIQRFETYQLTIDPKEAEVVWVTEETASEMTLERDSEKWAFAENWMAPRLKLPGYRAYSTESSIDVFDVLLSPADLFWLYFHNSSYLLDCLLKGATEPVLARVFRKPPRIFGDKLLCYPQDIGTSKKFKAAVQLANFQAAGDHAIAYLKKSANIMVQSLLLEGRTFSHFPWFLPFSEPFEIEFLAREMLTFEQKKSNRFWTGQVLQAVQVLSLKPKHLVSKLCFEHQSTKAYQCNEEGQIEIPVFAFTGSSNIQREYSWSLPPKLVFRLREEDGPSPNAKATYDRLSNPRQKAKPVGPVDSPSDLLKEAQRLFREKIRVPFPIIRPVLGQAPPAYPRSKVFDLSYVAADKHRSFPTSWLRGNIDFPVDQTVSTLFTLVQANAAKVWTLGREWHPLYRLQPKISLIEVPSNWSDVFELRKRESDRQLCALIAKIRIHEATYFLLCLERQTAPNYNALKRGNLLIKPDDELWIGQDVLMDILFVGVRRYTPPLPTGWPTTAELAGIAESYVYKLRNKPENPDQACQRLLSALNKLDF